MKYSIRTKLMAIILAALILLALILGGISLFFMGKLTDEYAHQYVSLICDKKAAEINSIFLPLENSVNIISFNALEELSNPMNLTDEIYYENYADKMKSILLNTGNHTDEAVAVYLRFNPEICGSYTAGFFLTRESLDSELMTTEITDLSEYDESDTEYVGWYYQPIKEKRPIWMLPYYNKNIDIYMISYVMPLIKQDVIVGVLGMDIDFSHITDKVDGIKVYKSGYAYITDSDGNVVYHPYMDYGQQVEAKKGWWTSESDLENGMVLCITAPISEINASRNNLVMNIILFSVALIAAFILITASVTRKMVAPLQKLNKIANEISDGNYDADFNFPRPNDEIGELTVSFQHTVATLKDYMTYINGLAYKDSLTGVRNRTAYDHQIEMLESNLRQGIDTEVAIAVFDINNLKTVNDNLGHEKGDALIKGACQIICRCFNHSAVFRIGGDEFVAVIKDSNISAIEETFTYFIEQMKETWTNEEPEKIISIAYGYAVYDESLDAGELEPAFKRADAVMYENKKAMKAKL